MASKDAHMSLSERQIIETGIANGSSKKSIADTIGKNKSTVSREITNHRILKKQCCYPVDCVLFPKCKDKNSSRCNPNCTSYSKFYCARRDRSPGACNGCSNYRSCRFDKYFYDALQAHNEYRDDLVNCRTGINATLENIHNLIRDICPKNCNLKDLRLDSQEKADRISIHINSYPKEKLKGKTSFQLIRFYCSDMADKLESCSIAPIDADNVILKPYLLK